MADSQKTNRNKHVNKMVFAYNFTKNDVTGFSPFKLLFGRKSKLPLDVIFGNVQTPLSRKYPDYVKQWKQAMKEAHRIAAEKAGQCAARGRDRFNEKARSSDLQPGDRVLIRNFDERGGPGKLRAFWEDKIHIIKTEKDQTVLFMKLLLRMELVELVRYIKIYYYLVLVCHMKLQNKSKLNQLRKSY